MSAHSLKELQDRLNIRFKNDDLLKRALTHSSLSGDADVNDLERLEFLGDRVLGLLTAEELWRRYPEMDEGELAPRLNALVRKETCAKAARFFRLGDYIRMSSWEEESGGRDKTAILGDVMEAFLGAVYVDQGLEAARTIYDQFWTANLEALAKFHRDAKTALQEWSQQQKLGTPHYTVLKADGPAHAPAFEVSVKVKSKKEATGAGPSKRSAQMAAARSFLMREGVWEQDD